MIISSMKLKHFHNNIILNEKGEFSYLRKRGKNLFVPCKVEYYYLMSIFVFNTMYETSIICIKGYY